jgi:hypothetical protein
MTVGGPAGRRVEGAAHTGASSSAAMTWCAPTGRCGRPQPPFCRAECRIGTGCPRAGATPMHPLGQQGSGASGTGRWGCPRAGRGASTVHSAGPARSAAQSAPAPPPVSRPGGVLASRVISCERRACLMRGLRPTPGRSPSPSSPRRRSGPSGSHRLPATAKRGGDGRHSPSVPGRRDDLRPTDPIRRGRSRRCSSRSAFLQCLTQTSGWLIERPESAPGVTRLPTSCADDTGRRQRTHDRE